MDIRIRNTEVKLIKKVGWVVRGGDEACSSSSKTPEDRCTHTDAKMVGCVDDALWKMPSWLI